MGESYAVIIEKLDDDLQLKDSELVDLRLAFRWFTKASASAMSSVCIMFVSCCTCDVNFSCGSVLTRLSRK